MAEKTVEEAWEERGATYEWGGRFEEAFADGWRAREAALEQEWQAVGRIDLGGGREHRFAWAADSR